MKRTQIEKARLAMLAAQRAPWEQGVASQALMELGDDAAVVLMATEAVLRQGQDGRLGLTGGANTVTDPASNGPAVLHAFKVTGDKRFKEAADAQYRYLKDAAPRTANGTLRHFTNRTQVWSDSMYMAPPFLACYGDFDETVKQVDGFLGYLWDEEKQMLSHMWDDEAATFRRKDCWGGGNGWSAAGMAMVIDLLPAERRAQREHLTDTTRRLLDGCIAYMRPDGLFHDVVDDPQSFVETNLSQMLAYAIYKGVRSGWLDRSYLQAADRMRIAALGKIDTWGLVQGACGSPTFDRPGTSTEAQAFFLMMEAAHDAVSS